MSLIKSPTFANTAFLASLHKAAPARAAPYPSSTVEGNRVSRGMAVTVAPEASIVKASTAYLKVKGTCKRNETLGRVQVNEANVHSVTHIELEETDFIIHEA